MTLTMLHVDRARTRMPLVCSVISMLVLTVFVALCFVSRLLETTHSAPDSRGAKSIQVPQSNASATTASTAETPDPYANEPWIHYGREF